MFVLTYYYISWRIFQLSNIYQNILLLKRKISATLHQGSKKKTAGSIGFIRKALCHEMTPKFAQVQGNFINKKNKYKAEKVYFLSHLNDDVCSLKRFCKKHYSHCPELRQFTGKILYLVIINHIMFLPICLVNIVFFVFFKHSLCKGLHGSNIKRFE